MTAMVAVAYVLAAVGVMALEGSFIYFPTRGGRCTDSGRDVWLRASDATKLHARYLERRDAHTALLYLHGNAGNLAQRSDVIDLLSQLGTHVLALDYRGYGHSEGKPSEAGLYDDARAALAWLEQRYPQLPVVVLGESLGGGPATELAATQPVAGLILQSTFTNIPDMAALTFPWLPTRLLVRTRFDNLTKIARVRAPKLIIHSRRDEMIPFAMSERLYAAAVEPKRALWLTQSHHNDAYSLEHEALLAAMRGLMDESSVYTPRQDHEPRR